MLVFLNYAKKYFEAQKQKMEKNGSDSDIQNFNSKLNLLKNMKTVSENDKIYMYETDNKIQLVFQEKNKFSNHAHTLLTKKIDSDITDNDMNRILYIMQFFKIKK